MTLCIILIYIPHPDSEFTRSIEANDKVLIRIYISVGVLLGVIICVAVTALLILLIIRKGISHNVI